MVRTAVVKRPGKGVVCMCKLGTRQIPSLALLFGKEVRGWRWGQLFLPNALFSLTIITKVTAINPSALRVTLCYLAPLPKGKKST